MEKKRELIAAVDTGTTGTRCCIFDVPGTIVSSGYCPRTTRYPRTGWAEQNPELVIDLTFRAVKEVVSSGTADPHDIACLCITMQRNSFVPVGWDGRFLGNMILWQDQRGEEAHDWMLDCLRDAGMDWADFYRVNGQPFGSFQGGFKALWLRHFREELYRKSWKFLTPQAFL